MRIAIVEDDPLQRGSLEVLLRGEPNLELVGSWGSAEEALGELEQKRPEVLLTDLGLPGMGGADLMRTVRERWPQVELVALTQFEERSVVLGAFKAGASGYLLKGSTPREIVEALMHVHQGGAPMSPRIARAVVLELREAGPADPFLLTTREQEVLSGLSRGLAYKEIGTELSVSESTVHSHVKHIYAKLGAKGRAEALALARRKGLA